MIRLVTFALTLAFPVLARADAFVRPPHLTMQEGLATIEWETLEPAPTVLRYGASPGRLLSEYHDPAPTTHHSVTLRGLEPSTAYHYAIGTSDGDFLESPEHRFLSPPREFGTASHLTGMPVLEELSPGPGEEGVSAEVAVEVRLVDEGPGIAPEGIELEVDGVRVQPLITGTPNTRYVYWKPEEPFVAGAVVRLEVRARNLNGVEMAPVRASFGVALDALAYEDDVPEPDQAVSHSQIATGGELAPGQSCSSSGTQSAGLLLLLGVLLVLRLALGFAFRSKSRQEPLRDRSGASRTIPGAGGEHVVRPSASAQRR